MSASTSIDASVDHSAEANNFTPLRLALASLVMLFHFKLLTGEQGAWWPMVYPDFAVEGFYVISGILIYESYHRRPEWRSFFTKRIFRLYPLYLVMIVVQTILLLGLQSGRVVAHLGEAAHYFAVNAVFLNFLKNSIGDALAGSPDPGINPSLWTLKVEVTFYLLVPLIWLGVRRWGSTWLVGAFFAALLYTTALRWTGHMTLAKQIPSAMMYFLAGVVICIHRRSIHVSNTVCFAAAAIGMIGVTAIQMGIGPFATEQWRILFPFMVVPVIYTLAYRLPPLRMKRDFSYGVYLIHGPIVQTGVVLSLIGFSLGSLAGVVATVLLLALVAERVVERPFIRYGHIAAKWVAVHPTATAAPHAVPILKEL